MVQCSLEMWWICISPAKLLIGVAIVVESTHETSPITDSLVNSTRNSHSVWQSQIVVLCVVGITNLSPNRSGKPKFPVNCREVDDSTVQSMIALPLGDWTGMNSLPDSSPIILERIFQPSTSRLIVVARLGWLLFQYVSRPCSSPVAYQTSSP